MTTAILIIQDLECSVLNPTSFIVPKSTSLMHTMCAPIFGDLHLFLRIDVDIIEFFSSISSKETTIDGKISVYVTSKSKTTKVYDIEFIEARSEISNIHYSQKKRPILMELYLKPAIQKVGKLVMVRDPKSNIQSNY